MSSYIIKNGTILQDDQEVGRIAINRNGMRTAEVQISGVSDVRIVRAGSGRFEIYEHGNLVGYERRGLILDYYSNTFKVDPRELNGFVSGIANSISVYNNGITVGTITRSDGSLRIDANSDDTVMIIYGAFLQAYTRPIPVAAGRRGIQGRYLLASLALLIGGLGIFDYMSVYSKYPYYYGLVIFLVLVAASVYIRVLGRKAYLRSQNRESEQQ
ncbi:hypothetical protein [Thermoplasma sp.]|uniref:hypothetical protein n=1 Tax=Thermoplasma sp. TaxID=1973142 RepID=UPI001282D680|nr:hypothetical protein [Thermoplasma sp.]KAA8922782.1 MAG: hypothetical protein F6Q11_03230 [Thermoplasma sp.]